MLKSIMAFSLAALVALPGGAAIADHMAADELDTILASEHRSAKNKARDQYRHPKETLEFFGIEPGMTVLDTLPGSYYGEILLPYIGAEGTYIATPYPYSLYKQMFNEARAKSFEESALAMPETVKGWSDVHPKFEFTRTWHAPAHLDGTVDVYLAIRATHHMNRFDPAMLDAAASEAFRLVKPGGVVGIVQHRAPEGHSDEWAKGNNGYIKESRVIEAYTNAGFVLDAKSEINANPKDKPTESDYVWRLPPSLGAPEENKAANKAIGESDRMTLKFRKPLQ